MCSASPDKVWGRLENTGGVDSSISDCFYCCLSAKDGDMEEEKKKRLALAKAHPANIMYRRIYNARAQTHTHTHHN